MLRVHIRLILAGDDEVAEAGPGLVVFGIQDRVAVIHAHAEPLGYSLIELGRDVPFMGGTRTAFRALAGIAHGRQRHLVRDGRVVDDERGDENAGSRDPMRECGAGSQQGGGREGRRSPAKHVNFPISLKHGARTGAQGRSRGFRPGGVGRGAGRAGRSEPAGRSGVEEQRKRRLRPRIRGSRSSLTEREGEPGRRAARTRDKSRKHREHGPRGYGRHVGPRMQTRHGRSNSNAARRASG